MRRLINLAIVLAVIGLGCVAVGRAQVPATGAGRGKPTAGYTGPGDIKSGATWWGGLRAYSAATRNTNAVQLCNVGDVACVVVKTDAVTGFVPNTVVVGSITCDNNVVGANICTAKTIYDQSGGGHDVTQATAANRFYFIPSCIGSLPCLMNNANVQVGYYSATLSATTNQPFTISGVFDITSGTNYAFASNNTTGVYLNADTSGQYTMYAGTNQRFTATWSAFHAVQAIYNGASSIGYVDGVSNSLSSPGTNGMATTMEIGWVATGSPVGYWTELGPWPSAFSGGEESAMNSNQHAAWGF